MNLITNSETFSTFPTWLQLLFMQSEETNLYVFPALRITHLMQGVAEKKQATITLNEGAQLADHHYERIWDVFFWHYTTAQSLVGDSGFTSVNLRLKEAKTEV